MPLVRDEQSVRLQSDFLEFENQNRVVLKSNVYTIKSHYLEDESTSVACMGENCMFCIVGLKVNNEYRYYGNVNGTDGIVKIPVKVFFDMNQIEKMTGKEKRSYSWLIIKEGAKLQTKYTVSKDEPVTISDQDVEVNNQKLENILTSYEKKLEDKYHEFAPKPPAPNPADAEKIKQEVEQAEVEAAPKGPVDPSQVVDPEEIPF